ncbi:Subtilase family protein [Mucilaginibacter sp. OK268]|uniref:S8 family peptidase n=1 Tax=Mucilaginibacter sp. OK268 TaxID=1881048 RepID=UPI00088C9421|nr:S8 family peptidase [Mucilaginibacter sp. OK268]SDP99705.1 Subtilase family protein [Mucilaginibacter sp. OK268]
MPIISELPHIKINGHVTPETYRYPHTVVIEFPLVARNRAIHGNRILQQLEQIRQRFEQLENEPLPENIVSDDAIYVEFISEWNFPLNFNSLHSDADHPKYQIIKVTKEFSDDDMGRERYRTLAMLTKGGISHFIKHVTDYINIEKDVPKKDDDGNIVATNPKYNSLFANLELIQIATLREFWSDGLLIDFPNGDENRWWEVWFRRTSNDGERIERVNQNLRAIGAQIGQSEIQFPEHIVRLVKATANQLSSSLLLLDNLAELRNPQETADCFMREGLSGREELIQDLLDRTDVQIDENSVLICLLDSGVNNRHPLITPFLPNDRLYAYNSDWGNFDSWSGEGHGTGMAGLALYGDLTEAFASRERIVITHALESFKIKQYGVVNDPDLYGTITLNAINQPAITHPGNRRVFCLSITDADFAFRGRPSSWSAMIDRIAYGKASEASPPQLLLISSGNVFTNQHIDYTDLNDTSSVHDPGQAYNALTVGSYTMKDRLDAATLPEWRILAPRGGMSPSNSTSLLWDSQWPIKPDIVMEGGNMTTNQVDVSHVPELQLISTSKRHQDNVLQFFGDTSGAAALAAKLAAEIATAYPLYWPETVRGLIAHSAEYSAQMLGNGRHFPTTSAEKRTLLRRYGHGVPNLQRALYSASNCLHMIIERTIQPFQQVGTNSPKYHQYHLYQLPWPADILRNELAESNVRLKITLSYFIEPNPGDRRYVNNFQYHSHSLDFILIKPAEDLDTFKLRVSKAAEDDESDENVNREGEVWSLKSARNRGSLKKDFIATSGADLSTRHVLAVYPKNGWYRTRKKLGLANSIVRYSLIVSIETENVDVNIYNPVLQMVTIEL